MAIGCRCRGSARHGVYNYCCYVCPARVIYNNNNNNITRRYTETSCYYHTPCSVCITLSRSVRTHAFACTNIVLLYRTPTRNRRRRRGRTSFQSGSAYFHQSFRVLVRIAPLRQSVYTPYASRRV